MVFMGRQTQVPINQFNNLKINQQVNMDDPINSVLRPFKGNINPVDPTGFKLYLEIYRKADKLNTSVSNAKDIIDHLLSLANKYGCGRLEFMVETGAGANNIFM